MKACERLDRKIRRLFRQAGHPRHLNWRGSKKFESWILCLGLIVKQVFRLSFRRASKFLSEFYDVKMHWTTLQKAAKRLPKSFWQSLLANTLVFAKVELAAVDGTGFARSGPSHYYLRRIDRDGPIGRPVQMISLIDVKNRKFLASQIVAKPGGETKHVPYLCKKTKSQIETLTMDKGFDAEWLHQWLDDHGTFSLAPVRKGCRRGRHRKVLKTCFDWTMYWQRNLVESLFSALKRLFGSSLRCKNIRTQTAELFCRLIAYNIGYRRSIISTEPT